MRTSACIAIGAVLACGGSVIDGERSEHENGNFSTDYTPNPPQIDGPQSPRTSHLTFGGGYLKGTIFVQPIMWGAVPTDVSTRIEMSYFRMTANDHLEYLAEYSVGGTTLGGDLTPIIEPTITISPSAFHNDPLTDADILDELHGQIDVLETIPAESHRIFAVHFPPSVTLAHNGGTSCASFCGYHHLGNPSNGRDVFFAIPDCARSCGVANSPYENLTVVASRELIGTYTDADGNGWKVTSGDPVFMNKEISELCTVSGVGTPVTMWTGDALDRVQMEFSEANQKCLPGMRNARVGVASPSTGELVVGWSTIQSNVVAARLNPNTNIWDPIATLNGSANSVDPGSPVSAVSPVAGRVTLFWTARTSEIFTATKNTTWSTAIIVNPLWRKPIPGGPITAVPSGWNDGRVRLFWTTKDGEVAAALYDTTTSSVVESNVLTDVDRAQPGGPIAAVMPWSGLARLFWANGDGQIRTLDQACTPVSCSVPTPAVNVSGSFSNRGAGIVAAMDMTPVGSFRIAYTYGSSLRENHFDGSTWLGDQPARTDANGRSGSAIVGQLSSDPHRTYYISKNSETSWDIKDQSGMVAFAAGSIISYDAQITAIKRTVGVDQLFWGDSTGHLWTAQRGASSAVDLSNPAYRMGF